MKSYFYSILFAVVFLFSCEEKKQIQVGQISIIPEPEEIIEYEGFFELNSKTIVSVENKIQQKMATLFFKEFKAVTGWIPKISINNNNADIIFSTDEIIVSEGYQLVVNPNKTKIKASSNAGFFYGLQTFKKILPPSFFGLKKIENIAYHIPTVTINDKPNFKWRGYMLDVSRHFFDKQQVKKVLDFMAEIKLNRFHWHLSDDQGWRVEIKKYPKLTEVGAWRVDYTITDETKSNWWGRPTQKPDDKTTYGGFYTQEDIKEIVAYAKERYIEIIPEVDMPGHSMAIIASYPELAAGSGPFYVSTGGVMKHNTLNPGKEITFEFVDGVVKELAALFPYKYIHLGGDECNKEDWRKDADCQLRIKKERLKDEHELQGYFTKRVNDISTKYGKKMIGWDEILEGEISDDATIMSWRGEKGGIAAARNGRDVVMTPFKYCYLDLKQGDDDFEPNLGYGGSLLMDAYTYKIISDSLTPKQGKHILGIQGNLWTESISDWSKLTYMTFPRLYAIAENAWIKEENKNWDDFTKNRLLTQFERWDKKGLRYATSAYNVKINHRGTKKGTIAVSLETEVNDLDIFYTLDGSAPTITSKRYTDTIFILKTATLKATSFLDSLQIGNISIKELPVHKAFGAKLRYHSTSKIESKKGEIDALVDLNYGKLNRWNRHWKRINGDLDVDVIFTKPTEVSSLTFTSLRFTIGGVYVPKNIMIFGSEDGKTFEKLTETDLTKESLEQGRNKVKTIISFNSKVVKVLKIKAKSLNPIPKGHFRAGQESKIQIDELIIN